MPPKANLNIKLRAIELFQKEKNITEKYLNLMLSNDRIFDYGSAMKKVVDIIMNLDTDIYVKAWKRSGK